MLSIVIPVHNEEHSILPLYDRLTDVLMSLARPYEILYVDDASTDRSAELLRNLVETDPHLKVIRLRRNFGQTAALSAGFHEARGNVIIAMDGDLQHAPEDIPALLALRMWSLLRLQFQVRVPVRAVAARGIPADPAMEDSSPTT